MKDSECVQVLDLKRETFIRGYKIPNRISDDLIEWFKSNKDRHSKVNRRADITDKNTTIKKSTDISVNPDDLKYEPVFDYVKYLNACIEEYIKCLKDPVYFIDTYCKIVTLDEGLQPFKLYPCQVDKIKLIHE